MKSKYLEERQGCLMTQEEMMDAVKWDHLVLNPFFITDNIVSQNTVFLANVATEL